MLEYFVGCAMVNTVVEVEDLLKAGLCCLVLLCTLLLHSSSLSLYFVQSVSAHFSLITVAGSTSSSSSSSSSSPSSAFKEENISLSFSKMLAAISKDYSTSCRSESSNKSLVVSPPP